MARFALPAVILLGLALRIAYTSAVYGATLDLDYPGDYWDYHIAAKQILAGDSAFSHRIFLVRPPLYPLLAAALDLQRPPLILLNQLLAILIIPATYRLARELRLSPSLALLAALLVALDPTSVKYSGVLLAEPLANLLLAFAFVACLISRRVDTRAETIGWALLASVLIALSALTRPAAYLLWLPLAAWIAASRRDRALRILAAAAISAPALLGMSLWQRHNALAFDNGSFTSVGAYNLLYYRAAAALHLAQGREDFEAAQTSLARRVEARLGNDSGEITHDSRDVHRAGSARVEAALVATALETLREQPAAFALATLVGAYQTLIEVWGGLSIPGAIWNLALLLAAAVSLWRLLRRRRFSDAMFLLLPSAYFVAGTALVCTTCMDSRARVMITPLLAVMAAIGLRRLIERWRPSRHPMGGGVC